MNRQQIEGLFAALRTHLAIFRRMVRQMPEDKINFRPVPEVRTAGEIAAHAYGLLTEATGTALVGKHVPSEPPAFSNKDELLAYMDSQVAQCYADLKNITEEHVSATLSAYGQEFPCWKMLGFVYDETLHHRGQFTVYLRLAGIEPVMIYDVEGAKADYR